MITAVVAIIEYNNLVLIGKKVESRTHIFGGGWHIPGGKVVEGELPEEAVVREILEETGLDVVVQSKLADSRQPGKHVIWFLCKPTGIGTLRPGDDLSDAKFVSKDTALELLHDRAIKVWPKEVLAYMQS